MSGTKLAINSNRLVERGSSTKVRRMGTQGKLRFAAQSLVDAEDILRKAADAYPFLDGPGRAFQRMAKAANRPLRIGILGEANSGKSSLANLLAGVSALPADPVANTRLPALLKYAAKPSVTAIYESGERIAFPVRQNVAQVVAAIQDSGGKGYLPAGKSVPPGRVKIAGSGASKRHPSFSRNSGPSRWPPGGAGLRHGCRDLDDSCDAGLV